MLVFTKHETPTFRTTKEPWQCRRDGSIIGCSMSMSFCVPDNISQNPILHISRLDSARPMALLAHAKTGKKGHYSLETLPKCVCRGGIPEDSRKPPTRLMLTDNGHSLGSSNCSTFLTSLCEAPCSAIPDASLWHAVWPLEWFPPTSPPVAVLTVHHTALSFLDSTQWRPCFPDS